ncbi:MAG TPA: GAF domain-containing protein [Candidatus Limnocylindrales bacterium]|nr:GAF domain-containing protein [Candidatus Limnocylindrales bacterium]
MITINKQFNLVFDESLIQISNTRKFPFKCVLSFSPFIDFWNQTGSWDQAFKAPLIKKVREELEKVPELLGPIEDLSILEKHKELIDMLMTLVFPPAFWDRDYLAAIIPYHFRIFYATPSFKRFLMEDKNFIGRTHLDERAMTYGTLLKAYSQILQKFYDVKFEFEYPLIFTTRDPETGLDRHFKLNFDPRFCEVKKVGEVKLLTDEEKKYLFNNLTNLKTWMELIPPENFEFHGFTVITATDVTDQEVLSSLKRDLIDRESIVSNKKFRSLQEKLRTLLRLPDLVLGLAAIQGDQVFLINYGRKLEKCCIFSDSQHFKTSDFAGSIYERSVKQGNLLIIEDLVTYPHRSPVEDQILAQGIRSMIVAPLYYQDKLIGTMELGSPNPGGLNALNALKLGEVLPLFSVAVNRSMEELDNRVQAIIKKKYTAIHPSVDWRFRKAVLNYIEKRNRGIHEEIEQIVFDNVYPLFGATDIRGSSTQRNAAIQADLIEHLTLVREIILLAASYKSLPILDELVYRINNKIAKVEVSLGSGDEITLLDFLRREVEPLFDTLKDFGPGIQDKIQAYRSALDPQLGIIYRKRKDFEESVARINDTISDYLDEEEEKAQAMFPHYFEKHKTDGVDHGIYIGASLVEDGKFDLLYLKNLRLWQLMTVCGIARKTEELKGSLKLPLETTHLILVQNMPMSIRFRIDEKQFDVDGAYNIRYEIVKKRIDKATIKGGEERLTQPGKIAIVYSQPKEAQEYRQYIDYLQDTGYLTGEVEDLELEDLQGIQGLRALRVTVNFQTSVQGQGTLQEEGRGVLQPVN